MRTEIPDFPTSSNGEASAGTPEKGLHSIIGLLAHHINEVLPTGEVADLRRLKPDDTGSAAFWKLVGAYLMPGRHIVEGGGLRDIQERRWAVILNAIAIMKDLHRPGYALGRSLIESGYSELRFTRILRTRDDRLHREIRTACRFLSAKGQLTDLTDISRLVLSDGRKDEERIRRRIARSYFTHEPVQTKEQ